MNTFVIDYVEFPDMNQGVAKSFKTDAESFKDAEQTFKQEMLSKNLHEITDYMIFSQQLIIHTNSAQVF